MGKITNADIERAERELAEMKAKHHNCNLHQAYRGRSNTSYIVGLKTVSDYEDPCIEEFLNEPKLNKMLSQMIEEYIREIS